MVGCGSGGVGVDHETFLASAPVFTGSEFAAFLADRGVVRPVAEARRIEERWLGAGRVVAVRSDVFAVVDEGRDPARFQPWPFQVAVKLAPDAVLSHRTAVDFWGYSYTVWFGYVYSATRPAPETGYGMVWYAGTRHPAPLVERGIPHFGVVEREYAGGIVPATTMERTLVDIMAAPQHGGGWDEICRTLSRPDTYDLDAVSAYCDLLGAEAELRARIGFFFDHNRHLWDIDDSSLDPFRPPRRRDGARHHLDPGTSRPCHFAEDWNLEVPVDVFERWWEDFH